MVSYLNSNQRSFISSVVGLFGYGGWAYYANYMHGLMVGVKAAIVQGGYSFALTFAMTMLMERIFSFFDNPIKRFAITFLGTCLLLYFTSWFINYLAGTPEIWMTILPGYIIGTVMTFFYTLYLSKSFI